MNIQKKIIAGATAAALLASGALFAQTDDTAAADDSLDSFDTADASGTASSGSSVSVTGEGKLEARYYVNHDQDSFGATPVTVTPSGKVGVNYSGAKGDINAKFAFSKDILTNYQREIIDEITMRALLGDFTVEGGDMKVVWGKGDKVHVLDNFNANDYSEFLVPDYIDRRIAEPMFRMAWNYPKDFFIHSFRIEGVYTPLMTPDRYATSGVWTPAQVTNLTSTVTAAAASDITAIVTNQETARTYTAVYNTIAAENAAQAEAHKAAATAAYTAYKTTGDATKLATYQTEAAAAKTYGDAATAALATAATYQTQLTAYDTQYTTALNQTQTLAASLYPDTYQLKYGQWGIRTTGTIGPVDMGLSYYYGHYKQPSVNTDKVSTYIAKYLAGTATEDDKFLAYDKLQVFGAEAGAALGPVNLRGEFGYYLTDDTDGTSKAVHNNSLNWVAGFDYNIPLNNMNINVQTTGQYILNNSSVKDNGATDVDYNDNGNYSNDKIIVNLSDTWNHEKIKPECAVIWGIEHEDFIVMPKLTVNLFTGCDAYASGMYITNFDSKERSEFAAFQKNSFIQLGMKYTF